MLWEARYQHMDEHSAWQTQLYISELKPLHASFRNHFQSLMIHGHPSCVPSPSDYLAKSATISLATLLETMAGARA